MVGRMLFFHAPLKPVLSAGGRGRAVYVGRSSLLMKARGRFYFCMAPERGPAPQAVVLAPWPQGVSPGCPVCWAGGWFAVGDVRFWAGSARAWRPPPLPEPAPEPVLSTRLAAACRLLAGSPAETARAAVEAAGAVAASGWGGAAGAMGWGSWAGRLAPLVLAPPGHSAQRAAALGMVGLGAGSTPAGDDLLAGYVTTWARHRRWRGHPGLRRLRRLLRRASMATSPVSGLFLRWAVAGVVGRDALSFVDALVGAGQREPVEPGEAGPAGAAALESALARLARHGATSGWDFAAGAVLAAAAIQRWQPLPLARGTAARAGKGETLGPCGSGCSGR